MNARLIAPVVLLAALAAGCGDKAEITVQMGKNPTDPIDGPIGPIENPTLPPGTVCDQGYTYQGFGGLRLEVGRDEDSVGFDRDRVKPLSALRGEYARVLGTMPTLIDQLANSFGTTPPRWYNEPQATAISLFSSFRVAFAGCVNYTNVAAYDAAPTQTTAKAICGDFAKKFWSRAPAPEELDSCVDLVINKTSEETSARRKWAYGCASVLSSAGFLSY